MFNSCFFSHRNMSDNEFSQVFKILLRIQTDLEDYSKGSDDDLHFSHQHIHLLKKKQHYLLSKFRRRSLLIFIIKSFRTIVFIIISTTFRPICPPAFFIVFVKLGNLHWTLNYVLYWNHVVACSDSVSQNRRQVLSIPVLLLSCSEDCTCNLLMIVSLKSLGIQRL